MQWRVGTDPPIAHKEAPMASITDRPRKRLSPKPNLAQTVGADHGRRPNHRARADAASDGPPANNAASRPERPA